MTDKLEIITKVGKALVKKVFQNDSVKLAEDEAEMSRIRLESALRQHEIMENFIEERKTKHENKRAITEKSIPHLNPDAKPKDIQPDWIANFFDKHCLVSDEQIQELLARILAGEANTPGSVSKRTVNLFADFDQKDAQTFIDLMSFTWQIQTLYHQPLVYDLENPIYKDNGINFGRLMHLENIGMVSFKSLSGFKLTNFPETITVSYSNNIKQLRLKKDPDSTYPFSAGTVYFTDSGFELAPILKKDNIKEIPQFETYVHNKWKELGYTILPA